MSTGEKLGGGDASAEARDWNVDGRPGVKLSYDNGEYVIAQALENGITITWTTTDSAADAVAKCAQIGDQEMSATIRYAQGEQVTLSGQEILPFVRANDCWWVKLTKADNEDYVVFVAGQSGPSELASLGPPLEEDKVQRAEGSEESRRVWHLNAMMGATATPRVRSQVAAILPDVLRTIST